MLMHLRATYEDGFVLEDDAHDASPYDEGANIFHAILNGRPCAEHGNLVEFALISSEQTHVVDWTKVPEGARPVRERHMQMVQVGNALGSPEVIAVTFGYEYEHDGATVREIIEVAP